MYTIRYDHTTGKIQFISRIDEPKEGDLVVESIPEPPQKDGFVYEMIVQDGKLTFVETPAPEVPEPEPEPIPESEPIPASEQRRMAYEAECDPYSMAYVGYMLEGNEEAAAGCKAAYLAKKAEIRTRIPDEEG